MDVDRDRLRGLRVVDRLDIVVVDLRRGSLRRRLHHPSNSDYQQYDSEKEDNDAQGGTDDSRDQQDSDENHHDSPGEQSLSGQFVSNLPSMAPEETGPF